MQELYTALIAAAIAVIGAIATYIVNMLKQKTIAQRLDNLEQFLNNEDAEYYIECPNCKSKIILNKVKILISKD